MSIESGPLAQHREVYMVCMDTLSKHKTLLNVGPPSATPAKHWFNDDAMLVNLYNTEAFLHKPWILKVLFNLKSS